MGSEPEVVRISFQTLIGTVGTNLPQDVAIIAAAFQTLIGTVGTPFGSQIALLGRLGFQTLIGTVGTRGSGVGEGYPH